MTKPLGTPEWSTTQAGVRFVLVDGPHGPLLEVRRAVDDTVVDTIAVNVSALGLEPSTGPDGWPVADVDALDGITTTWGDAHNWTLPALPYRCYACHAALESVFVGHPGSERQLDNALWCSFSGGYGEFIDPIGEDAPEVVLCHSCAHQACDALPWLARLLQPETGHTHRGETISLLRTIGHRGADL